MKMAALMNLIEDNDYFSTDRFFVRCRLTVIQGEIAWK